MTNEATDNQTATASPYVAPFKTRRIKYAVTIGGIGLALVVGVMYYAWENQPVLGRDLINTAEFSVYAPKSVPRGYALQEEETSLSDGMLSYSFVSATGDRTITVTVQPRPAGFDLRQMTEGGAISSTASGSGTVYDLSAGGSSKHLLDTGDSLVFLTSPSNIDTTTMNAIANNFTKLN